jgi:uncharacterized membrane protein YobD (UPF0266 family)
MWSKIKSILSLTAEVVTFLFATALLLLGTGAILFLAWAFYTDKIFPIEFTARMSITKTAAILSMIPLIPLYGNYYEVLKILFNKKGC